MVTASHATGLWDAVTILGYQLVLREFQSFMIFVSPILTRGFDLNIELIVIIHVLNISENLAGLV